MPRIVFNAILPIFVIFHKLVLILRLYLNRLVLRRPNPYKRDLS